MTMQHFEPTFDSLGQFECPDWLQDAKLGIWSHWGPQSVPMCGDWYARNMYIQDSPQYLYHIRHYGHPSKFGYKDICKLWKAENFDPDGLMELYKKAGARYFIAQATHHDHFFNYASDVNRFNSANIGPGKDICAMWKAAADKYGLRFGLTEHLGASFSWWAVSKLSDSHGPYAGVPYDGNDPEYRDFYHDNYCDINPDNPLEIKGWYTDNKAFHAYWLRAVKEMIDKLQPDMLYSDGALPFAAHGYGEGLDAVAYLYNSAIERNGYNTAAYTQKDRDPSVYRVGVLDIEKSQLPGVQARVWQTDTCIGNWFYDAKQPYKAPAQIIEMLIDIISKNGVMLLNILQRPDGTIDDEARFILEKMADWYAICGEAVYGTRPFRVFGEGDTRVHIEGFREDKTAWGPSDFRFVAKGSTLYAFIMDAPRTRVSVIKSLSGGERVKSVRLLGHGEVPFAHNFGVLTVQLPQELPTVFTNCLAIELE